MKPISILLFAFISLLLITSCSDNNNNIAGSDPGTIIGKVNLNDEYGTALPDFSGVNISIKGTKYSTTSDAAGKWTLANVEAGTYDIIFNKPGYDSLLIFAYSFAGNGTALLNPQFSLNTTGVNNIDGLTNYSWPPNNNVNWPVNKTPVVKFSEPVFSKGYIADSTFYPDSLGSGVWVIKKSLLLTIPSDQEYYNITLFTSKQPNTSKYSYDNVWSLSFNFYAEAKYDKVNKLINMKIPEEWINQVFKTGDKMFARIYPGDGGYTEDLRNSEKHWVHLGEPAKEVSFIVP